MYGRHLASASFAIASETFLSLGSDIGRKFDQYLSGADHSPIVDYELDPNSYNCSDSFRDDYLVVELLRKYPYLRLNVDREAVALEKFRSAEKQCSETNLRLARNVSSISSLYTPDSILSMARLKIAAILGPFSWDEAEPYFGFGPGSTTSLPKRKGDAYFKFGGASQLPQVTKACSVLGLCALKRIPRWFSYLSGLAGETPEAISQLSVEEQINKLMIIVPGNRVTTVPKSAKTDRVIAIEPDLNMFIQKGIGRVIRHRLRRVGIDLNDQSRNQDLAREGSLNGTLATIDLSSASDTVSLRLVEELLPHDWTDALKLCRSPRGTLPNGELITYHKVSSMGNGFTFELESLIFWALCSSVISIFNPSDHRLTVYGDDIILSSSIYHTVTWVLEYCGFTVNAKKSFCNGPFRESCGKHFFNGDDVTPLYIRENIQSPDRMIWFANSIRRWARFATYGLDGRLYRAYSYTVNLLPKILRRPTMPDLNDKGAHLSDIALFGDFDECLPNRSRFLQCWVAVGVADQTATFEPGEVPYLLRQLYNLETRHLTASGYRSLVGEKIKTGASSGVPKQDHRRRWKIIKLPLTRWESYGAWLAP